MLYIFECCTNDRVKRAIPRASARCPVLFVLLGGGETRCGTPFPTIPRGLEGVEEAEE